ncbi:MAG: FAD-dependent oxidoreductase [Gaiella sp.]
MTSALLRPLALGPVELPNRVASTSHQTTLVHEHLPTDDFIAYHELRARGGAGLIVLEATAVHPSGLLTPHTLGGYLPQIVAGYRKVAESVRPHGTVLLTQLFHGGREQIASPPRAPALAPSAVPSARFRTEPRALRPPEIEEIVEGFARSAELAAEGGLDGVEISASHHYLIEQFMTPATNRREDEWSAGPQFLLAVVRAVRLALPGLVLGVRLSADGSAGRRMAEVLTGEDVDYVSLALGHSDSYLGSVGIAPPFPEPAATIADAARDFPRRVPLVVTSRITRADEAETLLESGVADVVGMTRALIADPGFVHKVARGRAEEIRPCIGCNGCIAHYHEGTPIACVVQPVTGRERSRGARRRTETARRVVVVGAGPAGLMAACETAAAGHEVTVLERADRVGGQTAVAAFGPGFGGAARLLLDWLEARAVRRGVEIVLDAEVSRAGVAGLGADAVVVAAGALPYRPDLPLAGIEVVQSWHVLEHPPTGRRVVVADWGGDASGVEAAELLAARGNAVALAVASVAVGEWLHQYRRNRVLQRLYRAGVRILQHQELAGAAGGEVALRNVFAPELGLELPADLLVLALGRVPNDAPAVELDTLGVPVLEAGDCCSPRGLEEALLEGYDAAGRLAAVAS